MNLSRDIIIYCIIPLLNNNNDINKFMRCCKYLKNINFQFPYVIKFNNNMTTSFGEKISKLIVTSEIINHNLFHLKNITDIKYYCFKPINKQKFEKEWKNCYLGSDDGSGDVMNEIYNPQFIRQMPGQKYKEIKYFIKKEMWRNIYKQIDEIYLGECGVPDYENWLLFAKLKCGYYISIIAHCVYTGFSASGGSIINVSKNVDLIYNMGLTDGMREKITILKYYPLNVYSSNIVHKWNYRNTY